ncbi:MAG TPA: hypothetical protein PLN80_05705 [Anaerolineaceae bacterium]|nr:hypothetical protein [Anaerolineaceae bacterium]
MARLTKFVDEINQNARKRHLLFIALTLVTVFINGYHYGTFDQVFHIPFLKSLADPQLFPGDPFISLRDYHFSFFWYLLLPFLKIGKLEIAMFVLHLVTTYLTFWAFWSLTDVLFKNRLANVLCSLALVFPRIGFPGFQIIEFSLLNRTFAIPFLIGALVLYLKKNYALSFLVIGLMFNIHLVYATFLLAMIGLDLLLSIRRIPVKRVLAALLLFALASLPIFLRKSAVAPGLDFSLRPELRDIEALSLLYTVYYPIGKIPYVWMNTLQGLTCAAMLLITIRRAHSKGFDENLRNFLIAILMVILVASLASYLWPITAIIQFQALRIGVFLLYLAHICMANLVARSLGTESLTTLQKIVLIVSYVTLVFPIAWLIFWLARKLQPRLAKSQAVLLAGLMLLEVVLATQLHYFAPGFHIFGTRTDWVETQLWARHNTPKDAVFITPPYEFWHYESDWRVFSERRTIATVPEFMVLHLKPDDLPNFVSRFEDLAPGVISQLDGDYNRTLALTRQAFDGLTEADFVRLGQKYQADYVVLPATSTSVPDLAQVYANAGYAIYQLP